MSPSVLRSVLLLALLSVTACASGPKPRAETGGSEAEAYQAQAEEAYEEGVRALERHDWPTAVQRFEEVKTRFAYSKYAPLSELRIGDTLFEQGKYIEAADVYRTFARLRASHPDADYAAFRVGLAHARQAPSSFFLLPPGYEKDLTSTREAIEALESFLTSHPQSKYADEARGMLDTARRRMAEHELYVAEFYKKRGRWEGVTGRLEYLLSEYGGLGLDARAKVGLADAYLHLDEPRVEDARRLLADVLAAEDVPPELADEARRLQSELARRAGDVRTDGPDASDADGEAPSAEAGRSAARGS